MELRVRNLIACVGLLALVGACDAPKDGSGDSATPAAGDPANNPNTFRADIDPNHAYAGQWASAVAHCGDEKKVWTIETRRMAIRPDLRFCVFDRDMYASDGPGAAPKTWAASAKCLAEGHESHDFLFFRVKDNLREMRVTFNDSNSVELVRCPMRM